MAAATSIRSGVASNTGAGNERSMVIEISEVSFTSTDTTFNLPTSLARVGPVITNRIGAASAAAGALTLNETTTSGIHTPSGGVITLARHALTSGKILAAEKFSVIVYGFGA